MSTRLAPVSFTLTGALITIWPGPDSLIVLRTAIAAWPTTTFYQILKAVGAAYLCWLGIRMIQKSLNEEPFQKQSESTPKAPLRWFSVGMATNLSNPKVGALSLSLQPQFVAEGSAFSFTLALKNSPHPRRRHMVFRPHRSDASILALARLLLGSPCDRSQVIATNGQRDHF